MLTTADVCTADVCTTDLGVADVGAADSCVTNVCVTDVCAADVCAAQERRQLVEEVTQRQEDCQLMAGDIQHLEQEQQPLLLLHERASSVVDVLQNLRHVVRKRRTWQWQVNGALKQAHPFVLTNPGGYVNGHRCIAMNS